MIENQIILIELHIKSHAVTQRKMERDRSRKQNDQHSWVCYVNKPYLHHIKIKYIKLIEPYMNICIFKKKLLKNYYSSILHRNRSKNKN